MNNRKVPIKNILYMFSYIWDKVEHNDFKNVDNNDDFEATNILSELFLNNIDTIKKTGLYKEYKENMEEIRGIKGKIDFKNSLNNMSFNNAKTFCIFDELVENNLINQIIKTTAYKLYKTNNLNKSYKKRLNNILLLLNNVDVINITEKTFDIKFNRNNQYVHYLIMICKLINEMSMLSEEKGKYKFINILDDDDKMQHIFELFINKFYQIELEREYKVKSQQIINWNVEVGEKNILPVMKMDTVLNGKKIKRTIIIDTKYYRDYMRKNIYSRENKKKLISENIYQINAYMNNINTENELVGILLYPMPYNQNEISEEYQIYITSNKKAKKAILKIQTINLNTDWKQIKKELLEIVR